MGCGPRWDGGPLQAWEVRVATVVNLESSRRAKAKALDALVALVENDLTAVNRTIVARMHSPVALIRNWPGTSWRRAASACGRF